jgi:zinc protease
VKLADVALPPLRIEREPSGLGLVAIERRGVPLFHARLSLPAGASTDPAGKEGLANFTGDLLRRGTARRDARGVDDLIEGMGAHLSVETSSDESALSLTVPFDLAEAALGALLEVALEPSFPEVEVDNARRRALSGLQSDLDDPTTLAGRALVSRAWGPGHPYGHSAAGRLGSVGTFTRGDLAAFHQGRFQPQGALLALCGAADPDQLLALGRTALSRARFPGGRPAPPIAIPPAAQGGATRALLVHKPDSNQAQVRIVSAGLSRQQPGWAPALVMNSALGGGFTSLLVEAIRVDRGLSYSVATRLSMNRGAGLSVFASFTKNETLRELVDVALEKMHAYAAQGPDAESLENAKRYLAGLFPFTLEGVEALAEQVADAVLDGVGLERLSGYRSAVQAVAADQVREAAARLSPARQGALVIVVGDAEAAQAALGDLFPCEVVTVEQIV